MQQIKKGHIEFITGPMFAGKTTTLLNRIEEKKKANKKIIVFKPAIDDRYSDQNIVTHDQKEHPSVAVSSTDELVSIGKEYQFVAIDEVQLFSDGVFHAINALSGLGIDICCSGLDLDYQKQPFKISENIINVANKITKLTSTCFICSADAEYTYRKSAEVSSILVGGTELYEARCIKCYDLVLNS